MSDDGGIDDGPRGRGTRRIPRNVLELDAVFDVLHHPRRRHLLYALSERNAWSLDRLARRIAALDDDVPVDAVEPDVARNVYYSLWHAHVPRLVEDDIVVFEEASKTVSKGPKAEQVLAILEQVGTAIDRHRDDHTRDVG